MVRINAIFPEDMLQKLDDIAKDKKKSQKILQFIISVFL